MAFASGLTLWLSRMRRAGFALDVRTRLSRERLHDSCASLRANLLSKLQTTSSVFIILLLPANDLDQWRVPRRTCCLRCKFKFVVERKFVNLSFYDNVTSQSSDVFIDSPPTMTMEMDTVKFTFSIGTKVNCQNNSFETVPSDWLVNGPIKGLSSS